MPIVTCTASKATPDKGIAYIMDPEKMVARGSQGFVTRDPSEQAKQMMRTMHIHGKGYDVDERKYFHCKVAFDPNDREEKGGTLTYAKANKFAAEYARKTWPGREVVWSIQDHGASIHIHFIVAACNLETGKKLDARDAAYRQWKDRAQEMAEAYDLSTLDWRRATKEKRQREVQPSAPVVSTFAEQGLRQRGKMPYKDVIRNAVDQALKTCRSMEAFRKALAAQGIILTRCTDQTISYKLGDHRACRGDTLGGDYTVAAVRKALAANRSERKNTFDLQIQSARPLTAYEQNMIRDLGRLGGMKRSEVDALCAREFDRKELANLKSAYRDYRDAYWTLHRAETARSIEQQEELRAIREARIQADQEWNRIMQDTTFVGFLVCLVVDIFKSEPPGRLAEFIELTKQLIEIWQEPEVDEDIVDGAELLQVLREERSERLRNVWDKFDQMVLPGEPERYGQYRDVLDRER